MPVRILLLFTVDHNALRWLIKAMTESILTLCLKNFGTNAWACGPEGAACFSEESWV